MNLPDFAPVPDDYTPDDFPWLECPQCASPQRDFDGLRLLHCPACDFCSHPRLLKGICVTCGDEIPGAVDPEPLKTSPAKTTPVVGTMERAAAIADRLADGLAAMLDNPPPPAPAGDPSWQAELWTAIVKGSVATARHIGELIRAEEK